MEELVLDGAAIAFLAHHVRRPRTSLRCAPCPLVVAETAPGTPAVLQHGAGEHGRGAAAMGLVIERAAFRARSSLPRAPAERP